MQIKKLLVMIENRKRKKIFLSPPKIEFMVNLLCKNAPR